jgi:hypothetical protein
MFSRELPAAQGRATHLGVLRLPPPARKKAHTPGARLALIPACRDWRGAQDDRVGHFRQTQAAIKYLAKANKNRYHRIGSSCFWPSPAAQAAGKKFSSTRSLKTSKFSRRSAAIKSALAINQRVKSAIGASEKMERDSRSK